MSAFVSVAGSSDCSGKSTGSKHNICPTVWMLYFASRPSLPGLGEQQGLPDDFVLWVGRLDPVKNPRAFVELAAGLPRTQFVMIGGITSADLLREYGLERPANLRLLPQLPHADVLNAIAACPALVVTSFREGLPTLVLEAMTLRRPLVVPAEAGCLDATDGDRCAAVYQPGDIADLQQQLQRVLREDRANEHGRQRVLAEFDWRVVARKLDQIYRETEHQ